MKSVAQEAEPRNSGSVSVSSTDLTSYWTPTQIISELCSKEDQFGKYVAAGHDELSYAAVMYLRAAHARGETMCAYAALWCHPEHAHYQEFDRYWSGRGYPVRTGAKS